MGSDASAHMSNVAVTLPSACVALDCNLIG